MDNPLEEPRKPENFRKDVEDLARDLAYGATIGEWSSRIKVIFTKWGFDWEGISSTRTKRQEQFYQKWIVTEHAPDYDALRAFNYMGLTINRGHVREREREIRVYFLTQKAFDLLNKPARPLSIFISYRRSESSAFALLVESRLRNVGADPDLIFIDKNIPGGALWEKHIREQALSCDVFICLIGQTAFKDNSYLKRELEIVRHENPKEPIIVPVCHNGVKMSDPAVVEALGKHNGLHIQEETALEYEKAISFILNALGYKTY